MEAVPEEATLTFCAVVAVPVKVPVTFPVNPPVNPVATTIFPLGITYTLVLNDCAPPDIVVVDGVNVIGWLAVATESETKLVFVVVVAVPFKVP